MSENENRATASPAALPAIIKTLGARRAKLDAMDDRIGAAITLVEDVMRHHVAVRIVHVLDFDHGDFEQLAFTKVNGRWCLLIELGTVSPSGDEEIHERTALASCSREKRSLMFSGGHIEELLASGIGQVDREIEQRESAIIAAERLISALGPLKVDEPEQDDEVSF